MRYTWIRQKWKSGTEAWRTVSRIEKGKMNSLFSFLCILHKLYLTLYSEKCKINLWLRKSCDFWGCKNWVELSKIPISLSLYSPSGGGNSPCSTSKAVKSKLATWGGNSHAMERKDRDSWLPAQGGNSIQQDVSGMGSVLGTMQGGNSIRIMQTQYEKVLIALWSSIWQRQKEKRLLEKGGNSDLPSKTDNRILLTPHVGRWLLMQSMLQACLILGPTRGGNSQACCDYEPTWPFSPHLGR